MSKSFNTINIYDLYDLSVINIFKVGFDIFRFNKIIFVPFIFIYIFQFLKIFDFFEFIKVYLNSTLIEGKRISLYKIPIYFNSIEYTADPFFLLVFNSALILIEAYFLILLITILKERIFIQKKTVSFQFIIKLSIKYFFQIFLLYLITVIILFIGTKIDFFPILITGQPDFLGIILIIFALILMVLAIVLYFLSPLIIIAIVINETNFVIGFKNALYFIKENFGILLGLGIFTGLFTIILYAGIAVIGTLIANFFMITTEFTYTVTYGSGSSSQYIYRIDILNRTIAVLTSSFISMVIYCGLGWFYFKKAIDKSI